MIMLLFVKAWARRWGLAACTCPEAKLWSFVVGGKEGLRHFKACVCDLEDQK